MHMCMEQFLYLLRMKPLVLWTVPVFLSFTVSPIRKYTLLSCVIRLGPVWTNSMECVVHPLLFICPPQFWVLGLTKVYTCTLFWGETVRKSDLLANTCKGQCHNFLFQKCVHLEETWWRAVLHERECYKQRQMNIWQMDRCVFTWIFLIRSDLGSRPHRPGDHFFR